MMLPGQFGVYEQESGKAIPYEDVASTSDYKPVIDLVNDHKNYSIAVDAIRSNKYSSRWAVHFFRNHLLDNISFFYRTLTEPNLAELKDEYRPMAKMSYEVLKADWFKTKLKEHNLELEPWVNSAIEETYNSAKNLDK